ncbi:hypothetical protein [Nonomuraea sp. B5E05]
MRLPPDRAARACTGQARQQVAPRAPGAVVTGAVITGAVVTGDAT